MTDVASTLAQWEQSQLEWERDYWRREREREDRERARALALLRSRGPYQSAVDADEYNALREALDEEHERWFLARYRDRKRREEEAERRGVPLETSRVSLTYGGCALCGSVVPRVLPSRRVVAHACLYIAGSDR